MKSVFSILTLAFSLSAFGQAFTFRDQAYMKLLQTTAAAPAATNSLYTNYVSTASPRNDFTGCVGWHWTNGASSVTCTALGRWIVSGNSATHLLQLVRWTDKTVMASATLITSGATSSAFAYTNIAPVTLAANTVYEMVSTESASDQFMNSAGAGNNAVFSTGTYGATCFAVNCVLASLTLDGTQTRPYGPTDIKYTLP